MTVLKIILNISLFFSIAGLVFTILLQFFPVVKTKKETYVPEYSLYMLLPAFNEENIIQSTVDRFFTSTHKNTDLYNHIYLVAIDDGSIDKTTKILERLSKKYPRLHVVYRKLPNARKGKGHALNSGLRYVREITKKFDSKNIIIGVMDADAHISIDNVARVINIFHDDSNLSMVQSRVAMNNIDTPFKEIQNFEFKVFNSLLQNARNFFNNAAGSGNGQFFRLNDLSKNPWGESLLEDYEISTRLLLKNKKTQFRPDIEISQQPVDDVKSFIRQRSRWAQGSLDCLYSLGHETFHSKNLSFPAKLEMCLFMLSPFLSLFIFICNIVALISFLYLTFALHQPVSHVLIAILVTGIMLFLLLAYEYYKITDTTILKSAALIFVNFFYLLLYIPVVVIAIYQFSHDNHTWEKTNHSKPSK